MQFWPKALFGNSDEVHDVFEMPAKEAQAYEKAKARKQDSRPTSRSYLDIGPGEGRCTRELELIWWPSLYSRCSECGKLTFRFFFVRRLHLVTFISIFGAIAEYSGQLLGPSVRTSQKKKFILVQ